MLPSMGRIVFYHFMHVVLPGCQEPLLEPRARPAVVIQHLGGGVVDLEVFWHPSDRTSPALDVDPQRVELRVPPHQEYLGEVGKVERDTPKPETWSWPPRAA